MRSILALALCLAALPAFAHEGGHENEPPKEMLSPHEMAQKHLEHLDKMLSLKPDQKAKITKILEDSSAQMAELQKKLRDMERDNHEKIRALLDNDQKEKFDMMRAKMRMAGHHHGGPGMGGPGGPGKEHGGPEGGPQGPKDSAPGDERTDE